MQHLKVSETEKETGVNLRPKSDWTSLMDMDGMH